MAESRVLGAGAHSEQRPADDHGCRERSAVARVEEAECGKDYRRHDKGSASDPTCASQAEIFRNAQSVTPHMAAICAPVPTVMQSHIRYFGARKTSPWRTFQPESSSTAESPAPWSRSRSYDARALYRLMSRLRTRRRTMPTRRQTGEAPRPTRASDFGEKRAREEVEKGATHESRR